MIKVAIWVRVSTSEQDTSNQLEQLKVWAHQRDFEIVKIYNVEESAWRGAHNKALSGALEDARRGQYSVLLVWSLDRLSREGPQAMLEIVSRFAQYNVQVVSYQESWTEVAGELRELLLAIVGWIAKIESNRRSERTKAGMARAEAQGKVMGRPKGATDKKKRKRRRSEGQH